MATPKKSWRGAAIANPRQARTDWRVLAHIDSTTLVEVQLHTGRTHQIRVHFSALKHPVVGDTLYEAAASLRIGKIALPKLERNFLHAARLGFAQPRTGVWLEVRAPLPGELRDLPISPRVPTAPAAWPAEREGPPRPAAATDWRGTAPCPSDKGRRDGPGAAGRRPAWAPCHQLRAWLPEVARRGCPPVCRRWHRNRTAGREQRQRGCARSAGGPLPCCWQRARCNRR